MQYTNKITYAFEREPKVRNFLYSMCLILSYLLVIGIPIMFGYTIKIAQSKYNRQEEPPSFRPLYDLMVKGLSLLGIGILFLIIPASLSFIGEFISTTYFPNQDSVPLILTSLPLLLTVFGSYIFTISICELTRKDSFRESIRIDNIYRNLKQRSSIVFYFKFLIVSTIMILVTYGLILSVYLFPVGLVFWYIYFSIVGQMIGIQARRLD